MARSRDVSSVAAPRPSLTAQQHDFHHRFDRKLMKVTLKFYVNTAAVPRMASMARTRAVRWVTAPRPSPTARQQLSSGVRLRMQHWPDVLQLVVRRCATGSKGASCCRQSGFQHTETLMARTNSPEQLTGTTEQVTVPSRCGASSTGAPVDRRQVQCVRLAGAAA